MCCQKFPCEYKCYDNYKRLTNECTQTQFHGKDFDYDDDCYQKKPSQNCCYPCCPCCPCCPCQKPKPKPRKEQCFKFCMEGIIKLDDCCRW